MQVSPVTRYFMGITLLLSFCMTYQIISPYSLFLTFDLVGKGQVWRLITTYFFAGGFSMNFLFAMMMNYYVISNLEKYHENKESQFATLLIFNAVVGLFYAWLAGEYMVMQSPYVFSLLYVACKFQPDQEVSIWGFPVQSANLPWVLLVFHVLTGGSPIQDLVGIAAGHTYVYLKLVLPQSHGYDLLKTPSLIEALTQKLLDWKHGGRPRHGFGYIAGMNGAQQQQR